MKTAFLGEIQKVDSLLEEREYGSAVSLLNLRLRKGKLSPSSRIKIYLRKYEALRGLRTQEIPRIVRDFDERIKRTTDIEKRAALKIEKAARCLVLGLLRIAESEIQSALDLDIKDKRAREARTRACYNVLAGVCFKRSDYEQAIECLEHYKELVDEEDQEATYLGMSGRVWMLKGELKIAEEKLLKASEIYARLGVQANLSEGRRKWIENNVAMGWLELSFLYMQKRELSKAEELLEKAHAKIETWSERNIGSIHTEAVYLEFKGALASVQGRNRLAHQCFQKVIGIMLDLMEKERTPMEAVISQTSRLWAELLVGEKKYKQALAVCDNGFESAFEIDQKIEIGAIHRVWGQIYGATGDKRKAKDHFEKGIIFSQRIGANYELGLTYLECGRSDAFSHFDRKAYVDKAKKIFEKMEIKHFVELASELQKSLPKRSISASELLGVVKGISKREGMALIEFEVGGTSLKMKVPSSYLPRTKADCIGAHIKLVTGRQHGRLVPKLQCLD